MSKTQAEINNLINQLIQQTAGEAVDYYGYKGECLSLAKRWVDTVRNGHLNGPMAAPPALNWGSDYWAIPPASVQELFDKQSYDPNAQYPQGCLFVNTATHHIGIMLDNHPGQPTATVFHQNANPDGSPAHTSSRAKTAIDGILVIKVAAPAPVNPITRYEPKPRQELQTNKQPTNWWNLNGTTLDINSFHPAQVLNAGTPFTVGGVAHHISGRLYAMTPEDFAKASSGDYSSNNGINLDDLSPIPAPYVPPAAPIAVPAVSYYDLLTTVMWFKSDQNALDRYDGQGTIDGGTYVRLKTNGNAVQLTRKNTDTTTYWINSTDNKVPEIPVEAGIEPIPVTVPTLPTDAPATDITLPVDVKLDPPLPTAKPQYNWIRYDKLPVRLTSTNSIPVTIADMEGKWPTQPFPAHRTEEYSMYTVVKGKEYWLPDRTRQKGYMYALSVDFLPDEQPKATLLDHNANGRYDVIDIFDNGISGLVDYGSKYLDGLKKAVTTVGPKIEPVRQRVSKTIDGFSAKRKK